MKPCFFRFALITTLLVASMSACAAPVIIYNGDTLLLSEEFIRQQSGTVRKAISLPEVSGIACSRVTPGYIWMESDDYRNVVATTEKGEESFLRLSFSGLPSRYDWEDLCGGVYEGKNYLFVGAFGDNEETTGNYHIIYFEEPEIPYTAGAKKTIAASDISYEYPDGKHNAEAIMYDNLTQTIYVITKVYYNVCSVYSLPMSLEYGSETQTLTKVCDLGVKSDLGSDGKHGFHLVTGADISPDGSRIIIKNHNNNIPNLSVLLLWEREGEENLSETLKRQPLEVKAYRSEWQGEAVCWLDNDIFYTTSDDDGEPPIFKYISKKVTAVEEIQPESKPTASLVFLNGQFLISRDNHLYTLCGQMTK